MRVALVLTLLLGGPVWADDACQDLWFARNATIDRAGYCFGSALGQAVFDNAGCIGKSVNLPPADATLVGRIQAREAELGCRVNTKATSLDLKALWLRRMLVRQPVRDIFESACLGWLSAPVPLHAGPDGATGVIGKVTPGTYVSYAHEPEGGWTYVTVQMPDWTPVSGGWMHVGSANEQCAEIAG